jgi:methyl-accepting chemotaxis protein-1 (serine sensor receptor)
VYANQMASALKLTDTKNFLNRARFVIDRGVFHPDAPDLDKTLSRADGFMQKSDAA